MIGVVLYEPLIALLRRLAQGYAWLDWVADDDGVPARAPEHV